MISPIKIVIADDHKLFRDGLVSIFKEFDDLHVIGEAATGKELLELLKSKQPDVLLLDIRMPEMDGIEAYKIIHKEYPKIKVIFLSMHYEAEIIKQLIIAGINSYQPKNIDAGLMVDALRKVHAGSFYFDEKITRMIDEGLLSRNKSTLDITERQIEVLKMICKGYTHKVIASYLGIKIRTIDYHKANLYSRSGAKNNAELALYAIRNGLIKLSDLD